MGGVQTKGQSSDAASRNLNGLGEMLTAGTKPQSVSGKESVEVDLLEASEDSEGFDEIELVSEKKGVEVKLSEASKDSLWFDAIEKKNCKLLLQLFRSHRSLWVQTGLKGRSVLHVAVMQGCSELVHELYHYKGDLVPCGKDWHTPYEFLWENARDGRLKEASAEDVWCVMEGPPVEIGSESSPDSYVPTMVPVGERSKYHYLHSWYCVPCSVDEEMLKLREAIGDIANEIKFKMDKNDVDFNFVHPERKELYVHMACNMLRNDGREIWQSCRHSKMGQFIIAILNDLSEKNLLQKLFDQKDPQGRTILQILVALPKTNPNEKFFSKILQILPDACVNTLDIAGRTVLHWAVGHNYIWAVKSLLDSGKANLHISFGTHYYWNISIYLAITSIMLAIMTSLPIPKEGLVSGPCDDLKRSRRTISIAIGMLLASIISVLISFAASSLVVIPWQHRG